MLIRIAHRSLESNYIVDESLDNLSFFCYNENTRLEGVKAAKASKIKCESQTCRVVFRGVHHQQIFKESESHTNRPLGS